MSNCVELCVVLCVEGEDDAMHARLYDRKNNILKGKRGIKGIKGKRERKVEKSEEREKKRRMYFQYLYMDTL